MRSRQYEADVLAAGSRRTEHAEFPQGTAEYGLVVEDRAAEFCRAVDGSKESIIAARVRSPHVLIVGHPFVDVWAAVKPAVLGLAAWPEVPRGTPWKDGVLRAIGWHVDTAAAWQRILRSVRSFTDLEPAFLGRVEELIDFGTEPGRY